MAHGMTADGMAVGDHLTDQLRMVPGMISDDKKGGGNIFVFQQVKQDGGYNGYPARRQKLKLRISLDAEPPNG